MNFKKIGVGILLTLLITTSGYTADKKISDLNAISQGSWASGDLFPIVDVSATETKKTTVGDFDARFFKKSSDLLVPQYGGTGQNFSSATGLIKASSGTFSAASLVDSDVSASANLTLSKLAALTSNRVAITNGSGVLSASAATASQLLDTITTATAVGVELRVDTSRVDSYTEDGSLARPFKTIMGAINQIITNGDNSSSKPYSINIKGPSIITENIVVESTLLTDLYFVTDSTLATVTINPASGDALRSIASNANLHILSFEGFVFADPIELIGATTSSSFLSNTGLFLRCEFQDTVTVKNAITFDIRETAFSADLAVENVIGSFVSGGPGFTGNANIVTAAGNNKPGGFTTSAFILDGLVMTGDIVIGAGSNMQARGGARVGSPGGSLDLFGSAVLYPSFVRSNITVEATGALTERGGTYKPSTLTIIGGGTVTRDIDLTSYTSSNTASTVVARDASGNFSAGTITGALAGNATTATTAAGLSTVLDMAHGGSNKNMTASAGAMVYSDSDSFELTSVGSAGQVMKSNGTSAPAFADISVTNIVWVSKNGNDSTCVAGAITRPCLTLNTAYSKTTSLSNTNRYIIKMGPGVYNEGTTVALKGNVFVVGEGGSGVASHATTIQTDNGITFSSGGSSGHGVTGESFGLFNVHVTTTGSDSFNATMPAGISNRTFILSNVGVDAPGTISSTNADIMQLLNSTFSNDWTAVGFGPQVNGSYFASNLSISSGTTDLTTGEIQNTHIVSNLLLAAPTNALAMNMFGSSTGGTDLANAAIDLFIDAVSIPPSGVTNTGGGTYHFTTSAYSINFIPITSANWTTTFTAVQDALDKIGTGSFSTQGYQLNTSGSQPTCDVTQRGRMWNVQGGAGVADILQVCQKNAADAYVWATH